ncbi:MAG: leucine--tRNA ligase [Candidatus Eremiobacteraeota bacterium]|nr:leucine--tRNA ligase [Candidatus Eremiobacteraeota bacterium]MBV8366441.1 leucine--tRNA ligase [Candidatus Eremiobacteraeota bacterium]
MKTAHISPYEPQAIEPKWQRIWEERCQNDVREDPARQKFYLLEMLPYASGDLHVGHARNYTLGDVIARFRRMRGFNVMHPMGFDAFGLPAEAAAIQRGTHPQDWTEANIANMTRQLHRLGVAYDWSRVVDTSSPEYYRWTQWLFLLMYRKGLAYKKEAPVNWCPFDQTILANEQAEGGVCWRCGTRVEQRLVNQWFFKTTAYADRLLEGLDRLPGWPERIKTMQRNWIGRSEGVTFSFDIPAANASISTFTTRLDTVYGVTFIALAPDHPLLERLLEGNEHAVQVRRFVAEIAGKTELERTQMEKLGVFGGVHARHPLTGERVPIWVTNYVVSSYGTGAVMGVPAHDERDFEFAHTHNIDVKTVVVPPNDPSFVARDMPYVDDGVLTRSGEFDGLTSADARRTIAEELIERGIGEETINYKLRDWLISRQRYWGAPIPIVNCPEHGLVPVPEDQLPVLLPYDAPFTGTQGSPLENVPSFVNTTCPQCGGPAKRETDTMDTFMCSSWYFLRYLSPHDARAPWERDAAFYWAPVDHYIGGAEHAVMHLMYARFFYKVLHDENMVPADEPFTRLFNQGFVLGENHEKMSKSRGNVIGIDETADRYGIDALRLFEMFAGPPETDYPWSTTGIAGATRTLNRVWRLVLTHINALRNPPTAAAANGSADADLRYSIHSKIKQLTDEIGDRMHLNTCIAALMTLLNDLEAYAERHEDASKSATFAAGLRALVLMLAPFAPHITEELWERAGQMRSVHLEAWPAYDESALARSLIPYVIQVNGRHRGTIEAPPGSSQDAVLERAKDVPTVSAQLGGKTVRKTIFVKDKLLNIVVG